MPPILDLVADSRLEARFPNDGTTVHTFIELDKSHRRIQREEYWKRERYVGRGGFGRVQLEKCIAGEKRNSLRAVKVIDKPSNSTKTTDLYRELEAIAKFSHDRYRVWFIKSFGWYENTDSTFLTMEYCQHGDLYHYFSNRLPAPVAEAQQLTYQVLEGLHHMHENGFAHRDLKPSNILIRSKPPETWRVALADFGISKRAEAGNGPSTERGIVKGTEQFMAPELRDLVDLYSPGDTPDYKAGDMWALGEIAFQMLTGKSTFQNVRHLMEYCQGKREYPSNQLLSSAGDDGINFTSRLMITHPSNRMTTAQSLRHRWMASQYENIEERFTGLDVDQTDTSGAITSDTTHNASARWTTLSIIEDIQPTAGQRSGRSLPVPLREDDSGQTEFEQTQQDSSVPQNREVIAETSLFKEAAPNLLKGHLQAVVALAFSPDGKTLASGSEDRTIKLWNIPSGAGLRTLRGYSLWIQAIAFSPDGKTLASGSGDGTTELWNTQSGAALKMLEGHRSSTVTLMFLPDSKTLMSGSLDGTVRLWDAQSGVALRKLDSHLGKISDAAFSPDGKIVALAGLGVYHSDNTLRYEIKLLDTRSGATLKTLHPLLTSPKSSPRTCGFSVAFLPDGKIAVLLNRIGSRRIGREQIKLWDVQSGEILKELCLWNTVSVAYSPDGKRLASVTLPNEARESEYEINVTNFQPDATWRKIGNSTGTRVLAFSPDSKMLASGKWNGDIKLWNLQS